MTVREISSIFALVKQTVLVFIIDELQKKLMLIEKKRGMGKGRWNGPGGKIKSGETPLQAVVRECEEECGLVPLNPERMGVVSFLFAPDSDSVTFSNRCEIYRAFSWSGTHQSDNEECRSFWWPIVQIDYELFWPDDRFWLPKLLEGKTFESVYHFDKNNRLLKEEVLK